MNHEIFIQRMSRSKKLEEHEKIFLKNWLMQEADLNKKISAKSFFKADSFMIYLLKHIPLKQIFLNKEDILQLLHQSDLNQKQVKDTLISYILQHNKSQNLQLKTDDIFALLQKTDFTILNYEDVGSFYYLLKNNEENELFLNQEQMKDLYQKVTEKEKQKMVVLFCQNFQAEKRTTEEKIKRLDFLLNDVKLTISKNTYLKLKEKNLLWIIEQVDKYRLMKKLHHDLPQNELNQSMKKNKI